MSHPASPDTPPASDALASEVAAVRHFNRRYTRTIGVLDQHLLASPYSLTEARVLFELAHRDNLTAKTLGAELAIDAGYLSRIVQRFADEDLITRTPLASDRRQHGMVLTARGRAAYDVLDGRSRAAVSALLEPLPPAARARLVAAMGHVDRILNNEKPDAGNVVLRPHRPGDMGWVVQLNGESYAREYGWDISYEALCAEIVASFVKNFDPAHEHCWIAELDGERLGAVFVVRQSDEVAKLRLLLVDPAARGLGLGKRLVEECIGFARARGYRKMTLWTQDILLAARRIYSDAGFVRVGVEPHHSFGHDLVGETWELALSGREP
ncbi:MarR family transcriptional regulator [Bradyrhizobium sp. U87765 SZCCT0131]|uniref:bifunctional helix-turn-helix transcriptional regulator/GNAT family N-acetyltransferase n=1 Tax=unclassified Bradyrhizobium TaxID=2631580 RepID=UPI001BA770A3|nr:MULTISPECIES: helix-turn-helix domain-containing GNAT family N-acetyltransferase [unclassified Bradyrhizobium]MBR1218143.1 MarR family transcriptional regulator [Bradyrhizobium sp. U87765 SZCCT0131]MBR1260911.1 MarR family transcriptional regulator [Bradyrhizobium sp. U87765 SZCCT0134]MBR1303641.1 MarR family transcriptional regulator [Bradyrhizobium sp. U87765 SZCCT0110]MBR1319247.1 MarR family transcriptional regulator [Bradyrhizobium sp. U87765 SZCCT0109]MBR1347572.1 MarR family transcri